METMNSTRGKRHSEYGALLLRVLLGSLFIAHLYWKVAVLPGGLSAWWRGLLSAGYPRLFRPTYSVQKYAERCC